MSFNRIVLSITMLVMFPVMTIGQSEIGECGIDNQVESEFIPNTMFSYDGIEFDEFDLPISLQQALFDARLKHYKEQLKILNSAILELELEKRTTSSASHAMSC